jgi:hypothetical protein
VRGTIQPRTALQAAIMQPYQQMLEQQQAQQAALEAQQAGIAAAAIETLTPPSAVEPAGTNQAGGSASSESAGGETTTTPNEPAQAINTAGDKTPHQVLQNLYEARRQMIQGQHQPPPSEPQQ